MFELCCVKINLMKETRYTLFVFDSKTGEHSAVFEFIGDDEENDPLDRDNPLLVFLKDQGKLYETDIEDLIPALGTDAAKIRDYATWISERDAAEKEMKRRSAEKHEEAKKSPKQMQAARLLARMGAPLEHQEIRIPIRDDEVGITRKDGPFPDPRRPEQFVSPELIPENQSEAVKILAKTNKTLDYNTVPTPLTDSEIGAGDSDVAFSTEMDQKIRDMAAKRREDSIKLNTSLLDPVPPAKTLLVVRGRDKDTVVGPTDHTLTLLNQNRV